MNAKSSQKTFFLTALFLILPLSCYAAVEGHHHGIIEEASLLAFQISIILFAAFLGRTFFNWLKLPSVLGEIVAGVMIGPYILGKIPFWGFSHGIFPLVGGFPVSTELYSVAAIASIILLFYTGLETDIETFMKYSVTGSVIGISGVIFSFLAGDLVGIFISRTVLNIESGFFHPVPLFLGVISTATSVGISARILTEQHKMNSPEGISILSAAVIDDVLGIIVLAIIIGMGRTSSIDAGTIIAIALKAILIWIGFTFLGLRYSSHLSRWLKKAEDPVNIAVLSFALALFLAGIFEKAGLAMIIGAYVTGVSLSKTDLAFIIQEKLDVLYKLLVPVFFCVMGMMIDLHEFARPQIFSCGLLYIVFAILSKLIGCGVPALFMNFNFIGALRIGLGMVPRGEVALIVAGIGLASNLISDEIFSLSVMMTFVTTLVTPPLLDRLFKIKKSSLRKESPVKLEIEQFTFEMPNPETAELLLTRIIEAFENEKFFVYSVELPDSHLFQIRKDSSFITLTYTTDNLVFQSSKEDSVFVYTLLYEVLANLEHFMKQLQSLSGKDKIAQKIFDEKNLASPPVPVKWNALSSLAVEINLEGQIKRDIISELVYLLVRSGEISYDQRGLILEEILDREQTMSTGMQDGIALPHAKTDYVSKIHVAVGISREGVSFESVDGKKAHIFVLTLVPKSQVQPYLQLIANISKFLSEPENRNRIYGCKANEALYALIKDYF